MNCAHCKQDMTGRKRKYCDRVCANRGYTDSRSVRPITAENCCTRRDCDRLTYALGLCRNHYKQSRPKSPDRLHTVECVVCGQSIQRAARPRKFGHTCSDLCKKIITFGIGATCEIPKDHMARCIGKSCNWSPPKPKPVPATERTIACEWCGGHKTTMSAEARFCSRNCKRKSNAARRRAAEFNAAGSFTWQQVVRLWITFDGRCAYCQKPTALTLIQAEHVHPLSKQGRNDLGNLLPSCGPCNSDKRDLLLVDWNPDRLRRGLQPVATTWDARDVRYKHLVSHTSTLQLAA